MKCLGSMAGEIKRKNYKWSNASKKRYKDSNSIQSWFECSEFIWLNRWNLFDGMLKAYVPGRALWEGTNTWLNRSCEEWSEFGVIIELETGIVEEGMMKTNCSRYLFIDFEWAWKCLVRGEENKEPLNAEIFF